MAMDRLGEQGVSSVNHYTNSAAIIATKFEETIGGVKKTSKDTLGARFVTGLTDEIINGGDQAIAQYGTSESHAFSYDQSDLVRTGDVYRLTLKKDNTGYHAIFKRTIASEDTIEEYILYEPDALSVLDPDHLYVGFVVARGCNVTVNDVQFTTTNKADDPPGIPKPLDLIPITTKVDSPTTYSDAAYPFAYVANCDGYLTVKRHNGPVLLDKERVTADTTFTKILTLEKGITIMRSHSSPRRVGPYPGPPWQATTRKPNGMWQAPGRIHPCPSSTSPIPEPHCTRPTTALRSEMEAEATRWISPAPWRSAPPARRSC
jgi:hypothetical protein